MALSSKMFKALLSTKLAAILRITPTVSKYLAILLFLVNIRSWPLAWHFRIFRPVFYLRFQHSLLRLRTIFLSKAAKIQAQEQWLDSISPIGADPLNYDVRYKTCASIDDSDFNGHLSNSSYAKTLDAARFKAALAMFPRFFTAGGWMALAATHYNFIREIPMFASYEMRLSIGAWDQKWVYIVAKFVLKPSKKSKNPPVQDQQSSPPPTDTNGTGTLFDASLRTSNQVFASAPSPGDTTTTTTPDALNAVVASLSSQPEPDGAVLHTISVSQCCFKIGRITVPPALVLAVNGFSAQTRTDDDVYSRANPPPHWVHVPRSAGGGKRRLRELLKGGWRDVAEGERWWEEAMGGAVEERRRKALEVLKALGVGIAGARNL